MRTHHFMMALVGLVLVACSTTLGELPSVRRLGEDTVRGACVISNATPTYLVFMCTNGIFAVEFVDQDKPEGDLRVTRVGDGLSGISTGADHEMIRATSVRKR